jgi:hypothetical protein
MAMVDASLVLDAIVAVSIAAGAAFAVVELREMRKDRRTGLMLQLAAIWLTREFHQALSELVGARFSDGKEAESVCSRADLLLIGDFFEIAGEYVETGLLDCDEVTFAYPVEWAWEKLKPWTMYLRSTTGIDGALISFERLAQEAHKRELVANRNAKAPRASPRKRP